MHFKDDSDYYKEYSTAKEKLNKIKRWTEAYPIDVFPKPDFEEVAKILNRHGIAIDGVAAHIMMRVLSGIKDIINKE